jgi:hypothetical protein
MKTRLCPRCLKEFKRDHGKRARKENGGTWKGIVWPSFLYHDSEESRLCGRHRLESNRKLGRVYAERSTCLLSLGFESYHEYLKSDLWREISSRVVACSGGKCEFCGSAATEVHHSEYDIDTLSGSCSRNLHAVCRKCHRHGEYFEGGDKSSPYIATMRMKRIKNTR